MDQSKDAPVEIPVRITKAIEVEWKCPECHEDRVSLKISLPARFPVQCMKCGKTFTGVR